MAKKDTVKSLDSVSGLFNYLFEACNMLRGPISQDIFKDYITPILYYKRISDVYDEETQAALEESGGDVEYAALPKQHRFVIPEGCSWNDVRELAILWIKYQIKDQEVFDKAYSYIEMYY